MEESYNTHKKFPEKLDEVIKFVNILMFRTKIALLQANHSRAIESLMESENFLANLTLVITPEKVKTSVKSPTFADFRWLLQAYAMVGAFYSTLGN